MAAPELHQSDPTSPERPNQTCRLPSYSNQTLHPPSDRITPEQYCFFRYMQYFHDISIDAIYRDIFYDIFQVKIGLKSSNFIPGAPLH